MKKLVISAGLLLASGALAMTAFVGRAPATAGGASGLASGFAPGAATPAFDVMDVTGPFKNKVCYI